MATKDQLKFPVPETFDCPECRETIKLHDPDGSEFCACPSCGSYIRFTAGDKAVVQKKKEPIKEKPVIPLGKEGVLKGHTFKVIAYLEKKERDTIYTWKEYLLYNFKKGYATLAVFNGHWNLIVDKNWEPSLAKARNGSVTATHNDIEYRIFNKYTPVTTALIGELDWDVLADNPKTHEFIAPPFTISRESGNPTQYFWGEYTEPTEIAKAFDVDISLFPAKEGIGANQPSPHALSFDTLIELALGSVVVLLVLCFIIGYVKPERELLNSDYNIAFTKRPGLTSDSTGVTVLGSGTYEFKPFLTSSFEQPDGSAALEVTVGSYVDNNWLEATVILVNEKTNETWEITKGIEFYHGYEGGENWSEGSREASMVLSDIPQGKYHLNIYPASGDPSQTSMHISIRSNITLWTNILLAIVALILYPVYCWYRMKNYEKRRWMNSDHSPYES